jgi:SAM-dependent methyltransferase
MLKPEQDAYGQEIADVHAGKHVVEIVERIDGLISTSGIGPAFYFRPFKGWPEFERRAIRLAKGRVLDVGCGAGRVSLYLQKKGHDAVGIDNSPLAIKVCRERGVKNARVLSITEVDRKLGVFDTIVMFGNNFGLFGSFNRARWLLRRFHKITSEKARIIAQSADPYVTDWPEHREYQKHNRKLGRMSGQLRLRVRHKKYKTPWFDYLIVSREEMQEILAGTGWRVARFIDSGPEWGGFPYVAVIEKEK